MPDHLHKASTWMAQSISLKKGVDLAQAASFSNSIIIFFSVTGFLAGYLITRVFLAGAFRRADEEKSSSPYIEYDNAAEKLHKFWMPDGKAAADSENEKRLVEWLKRSGLDIMITSFLRYQKYAEQRLKAVEELNLN